MAALAAAGTGGVVLWERFESALQQAASATPDVSQMIRVGHLANDCVHTALVHGGDSITLTRQLHGKSVDSITALVSASKQLRSEGEAVAWCWETQKYEPAREVEAVSFAARNARLEEEAQAAAARDWQLKKAAMSKRERKKAEERERKELEARVLAAAAAADAEAAAAKAAREAEDIRSADPAVKKGVAYRQRLYDDVQAAVCAMCDSFISQAVNVEEERAQNV